jgi:hypothetical protein
MPRSVRKAQRIPNLTVSVGSQYDRSVRERVNTVGLSMPLPLFDRNQATFFPLLVVPIRPGTSAMLLSCACAPKPKPR